MQENDFSSNGHSFWFLLFIFTLHAQREQGKVIGVGVHIYIYVMLYLWTKIYLNHALAIDSPFQTFAVGFLVKFKD